MNSDCPLPHHNEDVEEPPVIRPPDTVTVDSRDPRPVLYDASGRPLVRDRRVGFRV